MSLINRQGWGRALLLATVIVIWAQMAQAQAQRQQNYTGDGGKGISLTIYVPQSTGLAKNQSYIPALVQGEFVSNFSNYSAISILDWERLDDIYTKLIDEAYDDKAKAKQDVVLGQLAPTSHFLTGNITKTPTGYNIKINITKTADKMTAATYSGTFTFAELDNLTGIRRASLELLQNVGVTLTEKAKLELAGAAAANQVSAQTALAKGVTAQRAGTEVAALSYYYQAASFDPALNEAVKRSSITEANIKSGNIGADVRNDIVWRKNWVARLKETEEIYYEMIRTADPPYTLTYFTDIKTGNINYQAETADLSIFAELTANVTWFIAIRKAVQAVLDGLNATNRKNEWGLAKWPQEGVSNTNPFASKKQYDITVVFELVNQQGRVIGSQSIQQNPTFRITRNNNGQLNIDSDGDRVVTVNFKGVKANDISDNLTIRIASVNGVPPQKARITITAMPVMVKKSPPFAERAAEAERLAKIREAEEAKRAAEEAKKAEWAAGNAKADSLSAIIASKKSATAAGVGRSRESIQRDVQNNMNSLRYVYKKRLRTKPELAGKITVRFFIDESGNVIFSTVSESTVYDSELENAVVAWVNGLAFDGINKSGSLTEVTYPITFGE